MSSRLKVGGCVIDFGERQKQLRAGEKEQREEQRRNTELVRSCSALQTIVDRLIPHTQQRQEPAPTRTLTAGPTVGSAHEVILCALTTDSAFCREENCDRPRKAGEGARLVLFPSRGNCSALRRPAIFRRREDRLVGVSPSNHGLQT